MVTINYIKSDCIPNKLNPSSAPLCALYYDLGAGENEWSFGATKAIKFLQVHDEQYENYAKNKDEKWKCVVDVGTKPDGKPNKVTLSWVRLEVLHHFYKEIKEYVSLSKPPKEAIPEPKIITEMDKKTGDFVDYLALPCYPKGLNDTGEGLVPKLMTQKACAYLFDPNSTGVTIRVLKEHVDKNGEVPLETTVMKRDGSSFPVKYGADEIKCLLKYRRIIQNYKDDPTRICDD